MYFTKDGGKEWSLILETNKHTGINEVHIDPNDPTIIYATAHQRRRHVFTYVGGGVGSKIYKSSDSGKNWKELKNGLPSAIKGRIEWIFHLLTQIIYMLWLRLKTINKGFIFLRIKEKAGIK